MDLALKIERPLAAAGVLLFILSLLWWRNRMLAYAEEKTFGDGT